MPNILPWWHYWAPQPGPQSSAKTCPADEVFYGGERGGGKSDAVIGRNVWGALTYKNHWNALILRRKYEDFGELRRRWDELILSGLPARRIGGENQTNYVRFDNGATIRMSATLYLEKIDSFMGHQYNEIDIDEAPEFPFLGKMIDKLKGCNRSPHGLQCQIFLTGNPGGPGASIIKEMFIPAIPDGGGSPVSEGRVYTLPDGSTRVFIRSKLEDNQILMQADPAYQGKLRSIKDPNLRAAWAEGRWDVFVGQAFNFNSRHILTGDQKIWPIPQHVPIYMTFDWGYSHPFSVGWWWVDSDDRVYRFAEWYGCVKGRPDVGLELIDPLIADGIIAREKKLGIDGRVTKRLCDPTCLNRKPNYKGEGRGPSTVQEFIKYGLNYVDPNGVKMSHDLKMGPGDPNRLVKIQQLRNRLAIPEDPDKMPMLMVYDSCREFIRTIPALCLDEENPEDVDTSQEDHIYDEACHIVMDRPHGETDHERANRTRKENLKRTLKGLDRPSRVAAIEYAKKLQQMVDSEYEDTIEEVIQEDTGDFIDQILQDDDWDY